MNENKGLERLMKHETISESVKEDMTKKKKFYEKKLAMITLILQKKTKEK